MSSNTMSKLSRDGYYELKNNRRVIDRELHLSFHSYDVLQIHAAPCIRNRVNIVIDYSYGKRYGNKFVR